MTNAELQAELAKYPGHVMVKVMLSGVMVHGNHEPLWESLCVNDAIEADAVAFHGNHLLIESK